MTPASTMTFGPTDLVVVGLYLLVLAVVGFGLGRRDRSSAGWFLAGRTVTLPAFVATLVATWYGGILGVGQFAHQSGLAMLTVFAVPYYVFALLFALWLAPRIRAAELVTIPDKIAAAYGRPAALLAAVYTWLMTNPAPYLLMLGVLLQVLCGWALVPAMLVGLLLSTVYVYFGGFQADVRVNLVQFVLMFLGFLVILPFCVARVAPLGDLPRLLPAGHLTLTGGYGPGYLLSWFFIALWTMVDPGFHQRCYAARDGRVAQRGMLLAILCWLVFDTLTCLTGLYARVALPDLDWTGAQMAYPLLAERVLPAGLKGLFFVGLLATVMSTLVSYSFLSGVTFARDFWWRLAGGDEDEGTMLRTGVGLVMVSVIALWLAVAIPSVVDLWWTIGTIFVPGLLLPLLTAYGSGRRIGSGWVLASMLLSTGLALVWLVSGHRHPDAAGEPGYPGGILPLYPGLTASGVLFGLGWLTAGGRRPAEAPVL